MISVIHETFLESYRPVKGLPSHPKAEEVLFSR